LNNLIEHFRNLMIVKVAKIDSKLIDLPEEICERLLKQAQAFSLEEIFSIFNILLNTQEISKRLDSLRIPLEIGLVKLTYDKKASSPDRIPPKYSQSSKDLSVKEKPSLNESRHSPVNIREDKPSIDTAKKEETQPSPSTGQIQSVSLDNITGAWQNIIENLSKVKISAATYLNEGSPIKIENNVLTISFPKDYSLHKESLEKHENRDIIEKSISELFNARMKVNFILSKETIQHAGEEEDGFLKSTLQMFKGRVIKER
jgi:DNA polymerase-3 subunit gamma/tau